MALRDYKVAEAGFVMGLYRQVGEMMPLTPGQAKYLAPPYGKTLIPPEEKKAPAVKPKPKIEDKSPTTVSDEG